LEHRIEDPLEHTPTVTYMPSLHAKERPPCDCRTTVVRLPYDCLTTAGRSKGRGLSATGGRNRRIGGDRLPWTPTPRSLGGLAPQLPGLWRDRLPWTPDPSIPRGASPPAPRTLDLDGFRKARWSLKQGVCWYEYGVPSKMTHIIGLFPARPEVRRALGDLH